MNGDNRVPDAVAPVAAYDANVDYVIGEYMDRLGTRLNILETELKYAWRALDLLSQEYVKMWQRLEKLEGLLYEQQSVIAQLLDFYTSGGGGRGAAGTAAVLDNRLGELEVIREILGNGTVEDGLEEGLDVSRVQVQEMDLEEMHVPDEAFYRSLNQAYREDLVGDDQAGGQLGSIWEEREEVEDGIEKTAELVDESEEVYSALDYKDYRGNSPCISEQDIAQLSRIDSIDHVAMEKLNELDRLSNKLQQDSDNIKQLQRRLLESPGQEMEDTSEHHHGWPFTPSTQEDMAMLSKNELPTYSTRPSSRLSVGDSVIGTDSEVAEVLGGGIRTPTSPRRVATCTAPFTTVTGRLAYSAAVQHAEAAEAASKNPFYSTFKEEAKAPSPPPPAPPSIEQPKTSPKKSDSGLSSMSGWSGLEKSPSSPKCKVATYYVDSKRSFLENSVLPGGHHLSAFTTVKSPGGLETSEGYGNFVPAPAPASDINVSPRRKNKQKSEFGWAYMDKNDQPAIYSVAGSNRDSYTSVYTSNSADYVTQSNYPDLVEPYENNEFQNAQRHLSYNSLTTSQEGGRRRSLTRMYSTSNGHEVGLANHEGYKTAMYRTMFPSGNITDALSYYPTSTRYDSGNGQQVEYNEPGWLVCPQDNVQYLQENASPASSMRSAEELAYSPHMDPRRHQRQQPIYENQQQIDQHRQWNQRQEIPYLELDLRNRNVPEYVVQQQQHGDKYFDPSAVIITQSGYITINSETIDSGREEKAKKGKKGHSLKSAMSSVSQWLPDLHLTKRHRSYSLPSGVRREDLERTKAVKSNVASRKKKKNAIVSTVSGILQKAKRKTYFQHHTQSLSDPEQSENEWVLQRAGSVVSEDDRSEDSYSLFSETQQSDLFAKVAGKPKPRKNSQETKLEEELQTHFEQMKVSPQPSEPSPSRPEQEMEEEISGKSTGSGSSSIFPTIGETKRSSASSEKSDDTVITESKMVVVVGGASMEFAVSRALGKYRQQKQTSSLSDDQLSFDEQGVVIEEMVEDDQNKEETEPKSDKLVEQVSTESQSSEVTTKTSNGDYAMPEGSPSATSLRTQMNRFLPRHQQSLEIPGHKLEDDDSRSTHSWRSTSRVSSRRQSTEDSIDSEDEWYCYELRKLEEMERQSQLEADMGETLHEEPELEEFYEPYEEVKEKMSFVLRELRMKAKVVEGVLGERENNLHVLQSAKHRENDRKSIHLEEAHMLFDKIKDLKGEDEEEEEEIQQPSREPSPERKEEEHSSGETSGPDSPRLSGEEDEEANDEFPRCHVQMKEKMEEPPPEPQMEAAPLPKIKVEAEGNQAKPEPTKEGAVGSKWKLLKALKERKAEEKSNQVKVATETTANEKDKVSMLGMVQKFYEIHVKT